MGWLRFSRFSPFYLHLVFIHPEESLQNSYENYQVPLVDLKRVLLGELDSCKFWKENTDLSSPDGFGFIRFSKEFPDRFLVVCTAASGWGFLSDGFFMPLFIVERLLSKKVEACPVFTGAPTL